MSRSDTASPSRRGRRTAMPITVSGLRGVSLRDVSAPMIIKRDDVISVTYTLNGLSLTLQAKAMTDAAAGQAVTVMNPGSKKIIQAVATVPGQAVVGPEADQLKAAARLSPSRQSLPYLALR